ncbi:MAG: methenyltetrahydrofolate cyclohydrolase [Thermoplasmata archaeon]|nr:MAG: methenyltetrahydrofolate cyclohydrolase [Thermoplasmata archaeon]
MLREMRVEDFVREVGSSSPAPGGGSVAALAGALSAALVCMVAELTMNKKGYEDYRDDMIRIKGKAKDAMEELIRLVDEDTEAFNLVMKAYRMPKNNEEEKRKRKEEIEKALKNAALVPLKTMEKCTELFSVLPEIASKGNVNSITDVGVAAALCNAAIFSAALNVEINLKGIEDYDFKEDVVSKVTVLAEDSKKLQDVMDTVMSKIRDMD